jgi:hypothetical protein
MPESHKSAMRNNYAYELNKSDGEIFRQILLHKRDEETKNIWLSLLSESKQNDVSQFLGHRLFKDMFDPILNIPGLFHALELGQLHRLLTVRCDEVSCRISIVKRIQQAYTF